MPKIIKGDMGMRGVRETTLKKSSGNSGCTELTSPGLKDPAEKRQVRGETGECKQG